MICFETNDPAKTEALAAAMAARLKPGDIIALDGDLGAGKTVFSKGLAAGLGIKEPVTSPTFLIMQQYEDGSAPLYHFDVYRIEDPDEMIEIGAEEFFYGDGICVIEWAERIAELLPKEAIRIRILRVPENGPDCRSIMIENLADESSFSEDAKKILKA